MRQRIRRLKKKVRKFKKAVVRLFRRLKGEKIPPPVTLEVQSGKHGSKSSL